MMASTVNRVDLARKLLALRASVGEASEAFAAEARSSAGLVAQLALDQGAEIRRLRADLAGIVVHKEDLITAVNVADGEGFHAGVGRDASQPERLRKAIRTATRRVTVDVKVDGLLR